MLAAIFLGQITRWDDPAITALNPGVSLPPAQINVVHRADGSGTTYIFSNYLSSVDPAWAAKVGAGKTLRWPTGEGAEGNSGVAVAVLWSRRPVAAELAGDGALRDHALGNFADRALRGTLYDLGGASPV